MPVKRFNLELMDVYKYIHSNKSISACLHLFNVASIKTTVIISYEVDYWQFVTRDGVELS